METQWESAFNYLLWLIREIVEDHSPTDNMTSTSSLELSASATANLSTSPTPLRTPSEGCAARTLTLPELLSSGTGLMSNWEELHSVVTMEMQMINKQLFYFISIPSCIPIHVIPINKANIWSWLIYWFIYTLLYLKFVSKLESLPYMSDMIHHLHSQILSFWSD